MAKTPYTIICRNTSKLPRSEWLELRRPYTGSSEAATCLNLNPWDHQYRLMAEKKGLLPESAETEHQHWGNKLERVVLDEFCDRHPELGPGRRYLMAYSKAHPHMQSNPDLLLPEAIAEAKTADKHDAPRWNAGVPDHYVIQGHHHMIVWGKRRTYYPVLFGGNTYDEFVVDWTQAVADRVIAATLRFWARLEVDDWPDPDGSEASMLALRARYLEYTPGVPVELPDRFAELIQDRTELAELVSKSTKRIDEIKALVMEVMGHAGAERAEIQGHTVATWRVTKTGSRQFRWTPPKGES